MMFGTNNIVRKYNNAITQALSKNLCYRSKETLISSYACSSSNVFYACGSTSYVFSSFFRLA